MQQEVGEDLLRMVGVDTNERPFSPILFSLRKRLPWLHVNLVTAFMAAASIPLVMKSLRLDPAQCASIILTTVTDVIGFLAFLGFAMLFRNQLI